jgi:hypothetical protein
MSVTSAKSGATGISLALDNNYMEPIATTLVGSGGVNTVIFNDIPQTYKHLQLRVLCKNGTGTYWVITQFNSDTGNNYSYHNIYGSGSAVAAEGYADKAESNTFLNSSSQFSAGIIDILDYSNTNKYKTLRALGGYDANGSGYISLASIGWRNTDPITSIKLYSYTSNFAQYSRFSLYGIKG